MNNQNLWEQREGESTRWYGRFTTYRLMGDKRSFLAVYNQGVKKPRRSLPDSWQKAVHKYEWSKRVEAWDGYQRHLDEQKYLDDKAQARFARQTTTKTLMALLGRVMVNEQELAQQLALDNAMAKQVIGDQQALPVNAAVKAGISAKVLRDLASAAAIVMKESRIEFGEPTDIQQVQGAGKDGAIPVTHDISNMNTFLQVISQREKDGHSDDPGV